METQNNRLKHSLIYGSITGGIIVFFLFMIYIFGMYNNNKMVTISVFLFTAGGFMSVKRYRDALEGHFLSYKQAYGVAFQTLLFAGIIWGIYGYLLFKFSPDLLEAKFIESQEALLQLGWSEDKVEMMATRPTALSIGFAYVFYAALGGALLALIIAAILKKQQNPLLKADE